jgi:hypothetical protein
LIFASVFEQTREIRDVSLKHRIFFSQFSFLNFPSIPFHRNQRMTTFVRRIAFLLFATQYLVSCPLVDAQLTANLMVRIPYKEHSYVGKPLAWDGREMMLLRRDGKISFLPVGSDDDYETIESGFEPFSSETIRQKLQQEFGGKYQVSVTRSFVVVHPPGDYQIWAMPFEKLYLRFDAYFSSRGFALKAPEFPMVAVVLRTRGEFDKFLRVFHFYDSKILGYYSPKSNRIITYDQSNGNSKDQDWLFNADTIIHEATHQTAFNTGVHSRFGPVPRWISEGLAMLFEAPGVNNSMYFTKQKDRINRNRLRELKSFYQQDQVAGRLAELVAGDQLFRTDPSLAYAISWGLTFYLSEKMPRHYQQFLASDAGRASFADYTDRQRTAEFAAAFGNRLDELEGKMARFIEELK